MSLKCRKKIAITNNLGSGAKDLYTAPNNIYRYQTAHEKIPHNGIPPCLECLKLKILGNQLWEDMGQHGPSFIIEGNAKWDALMLEDSLVTSYLTKLSVIIHNSIPTHFPSDLR